jgi:hypothetical protein
MHITLGCLGTRSAGRIWSTEIKPVLRGATGQKAEGFIIGPGGRDSWLCTDERTVCGLHFIDHD